MEEEKKEKKKMPKWLKILLIVLGSVLLLAVLLALAAFMYFYNLVDSISKVDNTQATLSAAEIAAIENETDPPDPDFNGVVIDPLDVTWSTTPAELIGLGQDVINILLIGQDRRPGEGRQRSDAMILCTINTEKNTLTMTSFLRDLYVQIPGYKDNRLNAAYQFGGMKLLNQALEVNFGIHVDGNVEVDFGGFEDIINMVGGVDIELTQSEANYMNKHHNWSLKAGKMHLNGAQALSFSRIRKIGTDFGRTNRQRVVLSALLEKAKSMSFFELLDFVETCIPLVTTDMSNGDIMQYAFSLIPMLSSVRTSTQHIPAEGTFQYAQIRGMSVLLPNLEANQKLLKETIGE